MSLGLLYWALAFGAALAYGASFARSRAPGEGGMVRALAIAAVALAALVDRGDWFLVLALSLLAASEAAPAFIATPARIASYFVFVVFFLLAGGGLGLNPPQLGAQAVFVAALSGWVVRMPKWPELPRDGRVTLAALVVLVAASSLIAFGLPGQLWTASVGAALLAANELGLLLRRHRPTDALVSSALALTALWAMQWTGCALIAAGFLLRPA